MKRFASWLGLMACVSGLSGCALSDRFRAPKLGASQPRDASPDAEVAGDAAVDVAADAQPVDAQIEADGHVAAPRLARNIIVFMGDGMGAEQLATGRFTSGAALRIDGMRGPAFVNTDSLSTAYELEQPPTDSAAAATAIATGVLVENGVVSQTLDGVALRTVLEACKAAGKATGIVTTAAFFDASPAAFTAHAAFRNSYETIAREILTVTRPDVVMGAGGYLIDDPVTGLAAAAQDAGYYSVRSAAELRAWDPQLQPRLLGLFATTFAPVATASEPFSMTPELERTKASRDPRLAMMTMRAIERLSVDPDGFFLFAEDELFDEMGHRGPAETAWTNRAYGPQVVAFDRAVGAVIDWVQAHSSFDETLLVVLSDHETGGYHFDHEQGPSSGEFTAFVELETYRAGQHTRTPVPVYALGPGSELLSRIHDHPGTHALLLGELQ